MINSTEEKALYKIQQPFMIKMLNILGIEWNFLNLINESTKIPQLT